MSTRTKRRSRSGAGTECPSCGKKLSGAKGLKMHQAEMHAATPAPKAKDLDQTLLASVAEAIGLFLLVPPLAVIVFIGMAGNGGAS